MFALDAPRETVVAFEKQAAALGMPLTVIRDTRSGDAAKWEAGFVLVRPNQFVAWAGDAPDDVGDILRGAIGA